MSVQNFDRTLAAQETLARAIVANPTTLHSDRLRKTAWTIAKQAFGQRVIQSRLPRSDNSTPPGAA
ncbi:hypothetical protein [Roseinatronobacter bogoriensis]|uniref:hypothetical protein n=1 Tax=Roseinatronobacter bogoriensis TaxID=119542 RepID=UPI001064B2DB|nr:hypothetical protein [Rhodobaca bogoriensis]MBB4207247.1 hypothetical protein [Rhodobaca bogoriensis DSM 18756]TDY65748.1 hypothetical protein EV660_11716 [Rhodobaca bogoriensis DSM 18756]